MFELQNIRTQIEKCTLCQIHSSKNKTVPGEGNLTPEIMIIGEAPGKNEDLQGKPFVGAAGITYIPPPKIEVATNIANVPFCKPHSIVMHFFCLVPEARNCAT